MKKRSDCKKLRSPRFPCYNEGDERTIRMNLFSYWLPTGFASSIMEVTPAVLSSLAIDTVLLDIDNTIIDPFEDQLQPSIVSLLLSWQAGGVRIVITSNSNHYRVDYIARQLAVPYLYHTGKPLVNRFKRYMKTNSLDLSRAIVIGDQLLTDAWFARLLKLPSIIVEPLVPHDLIKTRPNRILDRLMRHHYRRTDRYRSILQVITREEPSHE